MPEAKFVKYQEKLASLSKCIGGIKNFDSWINEVEWNSRFNIPMNKWLDSEADANMRIFLGMPKPADLVPKVKKVGRQVAASKVQPSSGVIVSADEENKM